MPSYTFENKDTGEIEEHFVRMADLDTFKEENPHLNQLLVTGGFVSERTSEGGRLPEAFKDTLREMKRKHPLANGISQV